MSESASIFDRDASSRPSYGGTTSRAPYISNLSSESSFTHDVEPGDTLQGIALKYGVKIEAIKRLNRLFTNESIHSRPALLIPSSNNGDLASTSKKSPSRRLDADSTLDDRLNPSAYLRSIDRSIEETTKAVKRATERVGQLEVDEARIGGNGIVSSHQRVNRARVNFDGKLTSGKAVRKGREALEKKEDEMFEL